MEELIFDKPHVKIFVNKKSKYLKIVWHGFVNSNNYRDALNLALSFVVKNKLEGWIADLRNMRIVTNADQEWTVNTWFPELSKTSLKKMGVLNSRYLVNRLTVRQIFTRANEKIPFDTMYFNDEHKCMEWLINGN